METALITGGAGFIGSHLCDYLLNKDFKVICTDNLSTGTLENIRHLKNNKKFKFIYHDINKPLDIITEKIDYVYDLASPASPIDYIDLPFLTIETGAIGTKNILEFSIRQKARFLFASTSEVYGDPTISPQPEEYWGNVNPIGIRSVYDEAKRYAEAFIMAHKRHGADIRIARIFNTYGERMRVHDGRVIPEFILAALKNRPLPVFGEGNQTRSFCYISDLIDGLYRLMMSDYQMPINLGNPGEFTISELAEKIIKITGCTCGVKLYPLPEDDPKQRRPDITKAKNILDWEPKIQLEEGLKYTIDHFKNS